MSSLVSHQIKSNYENNLKAVEHHAELIRVLHNTELIHKVLEFLHEVFQSGRFHGSKLLDIGSGPTLHNVVSASAFFPTIVLSEFVEDNRQELQKWLKRKSQLDWSEHFDIVSQLEGYGQNLAEGRKILESRVRDAVKCVIKSDLLAEKMLSEDQLSRPHTSPPYDLVMSLWCFEAVAPSLGSYRDMIKKTSRLLRDGGGLILSGFLECGFWYTGPTLYHHLKVTAEEMVQAVKDAGFVDIDIRREKNEDELDNYLYESMFCLAAVKKSSPSNKDLTLL